MKQFRTQSLACRVVAALASDQPTTSKATDDHTKAAELKPELKRIESFTGHIRRYSVGSALQEKSAESRSSPRTPEELNETLSPEAEVAFENEAATNQCFTFDVSRPRMGIIGPGGVSIPPVARLKNLVPKSTLVVMCLTWNVASRSLSQLHNIRSLVAKKPSERADIICISFQELPATNARYHQDTVKLLEKSLCDTHLTFCWVRKWSQMMAVFIRDSMVEYSSTPEWQFISSNAIVKPARTKGAIAVYFRIFQASILVVACHLSHGPVISRIADYTKICELLKFPALQSAGLPACHGVKEADIVFWFGDLNFRLKNRDRVDRLGEQSNQVGSKTYFSQLLIDDELSLERIKGTVFQGFNEANINFPPTHKFVIGTNDYVCNRIPSYTDRILFYAKEPTRVHAKKYDCLWEEVSSDHKPVYGLFTMRVLDQKY